MVDFEDFLFYSSASSFSSYHMGESFPDHVPQLHVIEHGCHCHRLTLPGLGEGPNRPSLPLGFLLISREWINEMTSKLVTFPQILCRTF